MSIADRVAGRVYSLYLAGFMLLAAAMLLAIALVSFAAGARLLAGIEVILAIGSGWGAWRLARRRTPLSQLDV